MKRIPNSVCGNNRDVYMTMGGRVLGRSEALRNCGVIDGSIDQVTNRMLEGQEGQGGEETSRGPQGGQNL